jgi:hypothetical protein
LAPTPIDKTVPTVDGTTAEVEEDMNTVDGLTVAGMDPKTIVMVRNADASNPHSVTFVTSYTAGGLALADKVVAIPASSTRWFSGFDPRFYGRTLLITGDSTQLKVQAVQS